MPATRRPTQAGRRLDIEGAAREVLYHLRPERVLGAVPDPACQRDPAGRVVAIICAVDGRRRTAAIMRRVLEQSATTQFGQDVGARAPGMAHGDQAAAVAIAQRAGQAATRPRSVDWTDAPPPLTRSASATERGGDLRRGHTASASLVERIGELKRDCAQSSVSPHR